MCVLFITQHLSNNNTCDEEMKWCFMKQQIYIDYNTSHHYLYWEYKQVVFLSDMYFRRQTSVGPDRFYKLVFEDNSALLLYHAVTEEAGPLHVVKGDITDQQRSITTITS